jgi:hypothetical protein
MICHRTDDMMDDLFTINPDALLADGFEDAYMGYIANHHHKPVAAYDLTVCVEVLMEDGMSEDEAMEYLEFNVLGAYVGEHGPLFVRCIP